MVPGHFEARTFGGWRGTRGSGGVVKLRSEEEVEDKEKETSFREEQERRTDPRAGWLRFRFESPECTCGARRARRGGISERKDDRAGLGVQRLAAEDVIG
jgi:hypothetical protein